ncbi:MAG: MFS transporter, partial [Polyangiaceae bacterium]
LQTDPSLPAQREPLLTRPFLLASASHFLHALAFNLYLHLSGFLKTAGATEATIGLIFGATGLAAIVARPPMGRIMDRRGRTAIARAGGLLHLIVCLLYGTVVTAGPWVTTVRIAHGVAEAMLFTSLFAYASDIVPASRRYEGIALFGVSGMLPISLGSLLGDVLLARAGGPTLAGYRHLFATSAVLAAAAFLLSLPLREPDRSTSGEPTRGMTAAFLQRDLLPLWLAGVVFATCLAAPFTFFATFVMTESIGSAGLYFSCYSIAAISLRILAGKLPERLGPKRVLLPAMFAVAVGLSVLVLARSPAHVALAGILSGMGHGNTFPILLGLVVTRARPSERGAALAIFTALFDAGALLGNPLFGNLVKLTGSYRLMFAASAFLMWIGTGVFSLADRRHD